MDEKYDVGDFFLFIKKYKNSSGSYYHFIGVITKIGPELHHERFHYKIIKDIGTLTMKPIKNAFDMGSNIYNDSKVMSRKEAFIEVL